MGLALKILVVGHDLGKTIFSMGGTILAFQTKGDEVTVVSFSEIEVSKQAGLSKIYEKSAELLGAKHECLFTQDPITDRRDLRDLLMDKIRELNPSLLIVPSPDSPDLNDQNVHSVVFGSSYSACVPNYPSPKGLQATKSRCPIFRMDFGNVGMNRSLQYVDVSDHWTKKILALDSLAELTGDQMNTRLKSHSEIVGRSRGVQVQREFAEAFEIENVWGRLSVSRLLP
jgi:LmbE family N-acetylglucosaminyl deacetylase